MKKIILSAFLTVIMMTAFCQEIKVIDGDTVNRID